ncbi:hypothetical protein K438DRAFT_1839232 [Mycena galopus ATCC 62051]|nr:hypothetical protein K438DRAFT_1839232 [Mycena galopus ATCC 62051]
MALARWVRTATLAARGVRPARRGEVRVVRRECPHKVESRALEVAVWSFTARVGCSCDERRRAEERLISRPLVLFSFPLAVLCGRARIGGGSCTVGRGGEALVCFFFPRAGQRSVERTVDPQASTAPADANERGGERDERRVSATRCGGVKRQGADETRRGRCFPVKLRLCWELGWCMCSGCGGSAASSRRRRCKTAGVSTVSYTSSF